MRRPSLVLPILGLLDTANALRPFDRRHLPSVACFAVGSPTSEFPLAGLSGVTAAAIGVVRRGGDRRRQAAALGVHAVSAAGLAVLALDARRSGAVYDGALRVAFGDAYPDAVRHPALPAAEVPPRGRPGLLRTLNIRRRYASVHDVGYGPDPANVLDIWRRPDLPASGRAPVVIQIPGGQWTMGTKQGQAYPLMSNLAERGWICVAINYRLSPKHRWPAHIEDVKRVIAWVRAHIGEYGGDPEFIALTGGSAGGHLASLAALSDAGEWQPGFEDADCSVSAVASMYGAYDFTNRDGVGHTYLIKHLEAKVFQARLDAARPQFDAASPMSRIGSDAPPFMIVHGRNDSMIPVEQGRLFSTRLSAVSTAPVVYAELPRAQHSFDVLASTRSAHNADAVGRFLGLAYGRHSSR